MKKRRKAREFWILHDKYGDLSDDVADSEDEARETKGMDDEIIHVREVLKEKR